MNLRKYLGLITLTALFAAKVYSFDLFDQNRGKPPEVPKPPPPSPASAVKPPPAPPPLPPAPPKPLPPQKDFTLRGTIRIGDKVSVILQTPDGKSLMQRFKNSQRTPVEGYPDYALVSVEPRSIRLEYPKESPCRDSNAQKGIQCEENGTVATVKLVRLNAIAPQQPMPAFPPPSPVALQPGQVPPAMPGQPGVIPGQPGVVPGQPVTATGVPTTPTGVPPASPFATTARPGSTPEEAQKREEERRKREELYKNFKRQTIEDKDVPPGMRVVRTPFGDRLVPDNPQPTAPAQ
ncbi:MAG: hypothetical protein BWK79_07530 [Beggiatoa sp. IS2]|nr:MAG: hypothetical protein BWK79_07530 [Beggiatoa sp. IS2]